jgi:glycine/D-amino acid oxidase-like deaminating enzyme
VSATADVIVVGAGVQGAALAFHLSGRGAHVLVLERDTVGAGSTGRSSGFVRSHYDLASDSALAWASLPYFEHWSDLVGAGDCAFVANGFVQLVPPHITDHLRANVRMLQGLGIETWTIGPSEVAQMVPGIITDDIEAAAFEPRSGYADAAATARGFLAAAQSRGARLEQGRTVAAITTEADRVTGVDTDRGHVSAPVVVNAAGPWAPALAASVGLDVPVRVWRHDTFYFELPSGRDPRFPTVLDHARQVYFRPHGDDGMLVGLETANELGGSPDRPYAEIAAEATEIHIDSACRRVPWMAGAILRTAHGGQDGMTPDQRAIIDRVGPEGHYLLCGFSGSGFKTAPAVGLGMAELILDGASSSVDVSPYTLARFERGELLSGDHAYPDLWQ